MDDEFALCWNNFQDNIATGFQNLYDRGDLVDVTLACDGKLLQAHKIVLAICSPYFQEMFITNPCKHPIIILKDVGYSVMCELLQFMYQGVVNVKHTELPSFMKMAQTLQIKGLTTSTTQKSPNQSTCSGNSKNSGNNYAGEGPANNVIETKINSSPSVSKSADVSTASLAGPLKRELSSSESVSIHPRKQTKRNSEMSDDVNNDSMEHMSADDVFLPPIPQISMVESRFDLNNVKRELTDHPASPGSMRNPMPHPFNFEYNNMYSNKPMEYPNELHMTNDYQKGAGNHMDIPPGGNITMLSSTSLLHGNCIFNRNNTVATQQGMKTYWLCKSYRITMCRARCITHQGRVISATGVHNHPPHMKSPANNDFLTPLINSVTGGNGVNNSGLIGVSSGNCLGNSANMRLSQAQHHLSNQQHQPHNQPHMATQQLQPSHHQMHHSSGMQGHHQHSANNAVMLQNMMQNVLSQNNLMHLTNMAPMLNSLPQHAAAQINNIQPPSSLQITPILNSSPNMASPTNRTNQVDSPSIQNSEMNSPSQNTSSNSGNGGNNSTSIMPVVTSSPMVPATSASPQEGGNCSVAPGERWFHGKLEFMLSQRGKPLLVHDGHTFGIQYIRKDKKYWQCNLSRKFNCKARVTTTDTGEIIVTNNEHCHTEIRQHLRKDYHRNKLLGAASATNLSTGSRDCGVRSTPIPDENNVSVTTNVPEKNETI